MKRPIAASIARIPAQIARVLRYVGADDRGNRMSRMPHSERALDSFVRVRCDAVDDDTRGVGVTFLTDLFAALPRSRASVRYAASRLPAAWGHIVERSGDAEVARRLADPRETIALLATYVASGMAVDGQAAQDVLEGLPVAWSRRAFLTDLERLAERHRMSPVRPLTTVGRVSLPRVLRGSAPAHDGWLELAKTLDDASLNQGKALADIPPEAEHLRVACVFSARFFALIFELDDTSSDAIGRAVEELSAPSPMLEPGERRAFRTLCHYLEDAARSGTLRRHAILYRLRLQAGLGGEGATNVRALASAGVLANFGRSSHSGVHVATDD